MRNKLNNMLKVWPHRGVVTSDWLESLDISAQLRKKYVSNRWIEAIGHGAYKRVGDTVSWEGALSAIQNQLKKPVHIAAKSALELQGYAHFVPIKEGRLTLFSSKGAKLPEWFQKQRLGIKVESHLASFLETSSGIDTIAINGFDLSISSPERAILEVLYLVPHDQSFQESKYLVENLSTLRPKLIQELLESCTSIKVKRLFLLLAEHEQLPCLKYLNLKKLYLGSGNRTLVKGGFLHKKYKITIPKDLLTHE